MSSLNLPSSSLKLSDLVLSLQALIKSLSFLYALCVAWSLSTFVSACPLLPLPVQPLDYFEEIVILLATTVLLCRYDYVYPIPFLHHPKSHPNSDPFPGATLKNAGCDCHGKTVCLQVVKKILLPVYFYMICLPDFQKSFTLGLLHRKIVWQK